MSTGSLSRKLSTLEIPLLVLFLVVFYLITDRKEIGYAAGICVSIGVLGVTFFNPRLGLISVLVILFTESTVNTINALAETAVEYDLHGLPSIVSTQWFAYGVLILYAVIFLSYLCTELLSGRKLKPLSGLELAILAPFFAVVFYFPISMAYGNEFSLYAMDIIPMCIYAGIIGLVRVFSQRENYREIRYFFLDWFVIINLIILVPLWAYNILFDPFRNGLVGITAIRYGTGPYDFNFFLIPLLGMILTFDDNLDIRRKRLYQIGFISSFARVIISLFRGAMGGTLIAVLIATMLIDGQRRYRWLKSLLTILLAVTIVVGILVLTVPPVRTVFNVALVKRIEQALSKGAGSGSLQFRELETQAALDKIFDEPWFGYGPGNEMKKYFDPNKPAKRELYIHSAYVWYWYKLGVLGILAVLTFFIGILGACVGLLRRNLLPHDRGWVIGTFAAIIAMLPVIHTNNMLIRSQGAYAMTLLLFGLCLIHMKYRGLKRDEIPESEGLSSE